MRDKTILCAGDFKTILQELNSQTTIKCPASSKTT